MQLLVHLCRQFRVVQILRVVILHERVWLDRLDNKQLDLVPPMMVMGTNDIRDHLDLLQNFLKVLTLKSTSMSHTKTNI